MNKKIHKFKASFPISFLSLLPYILSLIFTITFIIIFITIIIPQTENYNQYIGPALFAFFIIIGVLIVIKGLLLIIWIGYYYALTDKELIVKSGAIKKVIPLKEIKTISKMNTKEVGNKIFSYEKQIAKGYWNTTKIPESMQIGLKQIDLLKYCTNPVGVGYKTRQAWFGFGGIDIGLARGKAKPLKPIVTGNYFILIELKNGKRHLITPIDIDGFINKFKQIQSINI